MSYSTSLPGIDEARLTAIQGLIVASLSDLNAALARDALTPMTWTAGQVLVGDPVYLAASRISVVGGGELNGQDMDAEPYMSPLQYRYTWYTSLFVYLHPDEFPGADEVAQAQTRELALSRVVDHLRRRVFNDPANTDIVLTSREQAASPAYDALVNCYITRVTKGITAKSVGKLIECLSAELTHRGEIVA